MVLPEYKPEEWEKVIREAYKKKFEESLSKLQTIENLSEQDADQKLMGLMLKSSLIDRFLTIYGEQTSEELYTKINEHVQENPFTSTEDLHEFALYMCHLFIMSEQTNRFRNSGLGYRLFCQYIRERVELRDIVSNKTIHQVLEDFYLTIEVPPGRTTAQIIFKKREVLFDLITISLFAKNTTGFSYKEGKLAYNSDAVYLPLFLPILAYTVDTDDKNRLDKSREFCGRAKLRKVLLTLGIVVVEIYGDERANLLTGIIFLKQYPKVDIETTLKQLYFYVKGCIRPNGTEQIYVTEFTEIRDPTAPSFCSPEEKTVWLAENYPEEYPSMANLLAEVDFRKQRTFTMQN